MGINFRYFRESSTISKFLPLKIIIHVDSHVKNCRKMVLYKYLTSSKLPNPNGSLSKQLPASTIASANSKVSKVYKVQDSSGNGKRHGPYSKFTPQVKV